MRFKAGPPVRDFTLTLGQVGATIEGEFRENPPPGQMNSLTGPVSGLMRADRVTFNGKLSWRDAIFPDNYGFADLTDFEASVDAAAESISGTFTLVDRNPKGVEWLRRTCRIVSLRRVSASVQ
jgi:hypothetical protein